MMLYVTLAKLTGYVCFALLIGWPAYLVICKGRFWKAFILAWFLLVAVQSLSVYSALIEYDMGLLTDGVEPSDTTAIGLTMFSGWLMALPYCIVLKWIRSLLKECDLIDKNVVEQVAASDR